VLITSCWPPGSALGVWLVREFEDRIADAAAGACHGLVAASRGEGERQVPIELREGRAVQYTALAVRISDSGPTIPSAARSTKAPAVVVVHGTLMTNCPPP
jgi:hypothetical protein